MSHILRMVQLSILFLFCISFLFCAKPGSRSSFYLIFGRWIGGGFSFCHICSALVTDAIRLWPNRASGTIVDFVVYNTIFNIGWADLQVFLFVFLLAYLVRDAIHKGGWLGGLCYKSFMIDYFSFCIFQIIWNFPILFFFSSLAYLVRDAIHLRRLNRRFML